MKHLLPILALALIGLFTSCVDDNASTPDLGLSSSVFQPEEAVSQRTPLPKVYMRLTNQVQQGGQTSYDAEFRADDPGTRLTGMNVRIWIPANQFGWVGMSEFAAGYAASPPNPAQIATGNASSGPAIFGFNGPARYVNGAMQLVDETAPAVPLWPGWVKLFKVTFSGAPACPIVILDKEVNPANGGFYINDGITISCDLGGGNHFAVDEYVSYVGWQQTQNTMPFGAPIPCQ
jgi:hypothetical protein